MYLDDGTKKEENKRTLFDFQIYLRVSSNDQYGVVVTRINT